MTTHNNLYICLGEVEADVELFKKKFAEKRMYYLISSQTAVTQQRAYIIGHLKKWFKQASYELYLYYSGKGHLQSGNWKISTLEKPQGDQIKFQQIRDLWKQCKPLQSSHLYIFMDSCSSETWCEILQQNKGLMQNMSIFASCPKKKQRNPLNQTTAFSKCLLIDSDQNFQKNFPHIQGATFCHYFKRGYLLKQQLKYLSQNIQNVSQICDAYNGPLKDGQRAGKGKIIYESGNVYQGNWQNDQPNGQGTLIFKNKDKYDGNWKDGQWDGKGTFEISNQSKFVGTWKDGKLVGQVQLIFDQKNKKQLYFENGVCTKL